ncbi:hypothetical protein KA107_01445 [Candidatus Pacearchaeota archaeon]|nr:hypothetical protein [Candidatus Pacearchaeota archaeon]
MEKGKRGQVTIFIILGIVLVAGIVAYFLLRPASFSGLSKNLEPAYNSYLSCIQEKTQEGLKLMGQQAGYIYVDELSFDAGSLYSPSSSQLNFQGTPVPYWLYVSGNNILKEKRPTLENMEADLSRFIKEGINDCDFSIFNNEGIYVDVFDGNVDVKINDANVEINMNNPIYLSFENDSVSVNKHQIIVPSKVGTFYKTASEVFDAEKESTFLEAYALDVLRLNAPVTGVEITCTPKIFNEQQVKNNLSVALENNFAYLKLKGNYYSLTNAERNYYVVNLPHSVSENVNFIYSTNWPTKVEMYGDKVVQPVGNQPGMGMLGMCFVPYNFVYDVSFPVMIQMYSNTELFQFPMSVLINHNQMREALNSGDEISVESPICQTKNQEVSISTYDLNLNPVKASLRFSCLSDSCEVGSTSISGDQAKTIAQLPQCINGVLTAYSEGYAPADYTISTNTQTTADIILKKIHTVRVSLPNTVKATVVFSSKDYSSVLNYPESNTVDLVEGEYNITAYVYKNSSITFPAISDRKCFEVASTSFAGLLGDSKEQCFDVNIPAQEIDSALVGGGKGFDYFVESDLESSQQLVLDIPLFETPTNLETLQDNYITWEDSIIGSSWE